MFKFNQRVIVTTLLAVTSSLIQSMEKDSFRPVVATASDATRTASVTPFDVAVNTAVIPAAGASTTDVSHIISPDRLQGMDSQSSLSKIARLVEARHEEAAFETMVGKPDFYARHLSPASNARRQFVEGRLAVLLSGDYTPTDEYRDEVQALELEQERLQQKVTANVAAAYRSVRK